MAGAGVLVGSACGSRSPAPEHRQELIVASDGWRIRTRLFLPVRRSAAPVVVMFNAAMGSSDVYTPLAQDFVRAGVGALLVDLRGHGASTNRGRFAPSDSTMHMITDAWRDVSSVLRELRRHEGVDSMRIGVIGASYSAEAAAVAARAGRMERVYLALSPGNLSDSSIAAMDAHASPWMIVASTGETFLKPVLDRVRARSRTAEVLEVEGTAHATGLLTSPGLNTRIVDWFASKLHRGTMPGPTTSLEMVRTKATWRRAVSLGAHDPGEGVADGTG